MGKITFLLKESNGLELVANHSPGSASKRVIKNSNLLMHKRTIHGKREGFPFFI